MKAKLKENQTGKQKHNSKVMELSNLTELSDQEAELVIGGCNTSDILDKLWGSGGSGGGGTGTGGGTGG